MDRFKWGALHGLHKTLDGIEISYMFLPEWWRKGLASEAVLACLNHGFNHLRFEKIIAITQSQNLNSCLLLEHIGMKKINEFDRFGALQYLYQLSRDDFNWSIKPIECITLNNEKIETALTWITNLLQKHQIQYQIAGGLAAYIYGSHRPIFDIDIDMPEEKFEVIKKDIESYITYGPTRFQDDQWELHLITLNYNNQLIDLSGIKNVKIYDNKTHAWYKLYGDLSKATIKNILGLKLPVIPLYDLLAYKKILAREVDKLDIKALSDQT